MNGQSTIIGPFKMKYLILLIITTLVLTYHCDPNHRPEICYENVVRVCVKPYYRCFNHSDCCKNTRCETLEVACIDGICTPESFKRKLYPCREDCECIFGKCNKENGECE